MNPPPDGLAAAQRSADFMQQKNPFDKVNSLIAEMERLDRERLDDTEEEGDPRVEALLDEMDLLVAELDPIVRETLADDPAAIAEWDDIMHSCDDIRPYHPPQMKTPPSKDE